MKKAQKASSKTKLKLWEAMVSFLEFVERHPVLVLLLDAFLRFLIKAWE